MRDRIRKADLVDPSFSALEISIGQRLIEFVPAQDSISLCQQVRLVINDTGRISAIDDLNSRTIFTAADVEE